MRLLMLHVDSFVCTVAQKGRSPLVETPSAAETAMEEGILVLASVEAGDESAPGDIVSATVDEVRGLAERLKAKDVMLLPFAHLFGEPAPAEDALAIIDAVALELRSAGLEVSRPPFGWFHRWDLRTKGHPLSRVARRVAPGGMRREG